MIAFRESEVDVSCAILPRSSNDGVVLVSQVVIRWVHTRVAEAWHWRWLRRIVGGLSMDGRASRCRKGEQFDEIHDWSTLDGFL